MRVVLAAVIVTAVLPACVFRSTRVRSWDPDASTTVRTPVKVHLIDGAVVLFRDGFTVTGDTLSGLGMRYDPSLLDSLPVWRVPLDHVAGAEAFHLHVDGAMTVVGTLFATAGTVLGGTALALAIFGSCPTFYADSAGMTRLEAEGFAYSIAPLFEARDVTGLRARPDATGVLRLELRNEAAETHFINHLALLAVDHGPDETVLPGTDGQPLAVRDLHAPVRARDRAGRDVLAPLLAVDGDAPSTDAARLARAGGDDPHDGVELVFPAPTDGDSVALVLTLRNSLLTTVLLYDVMLRGQGAQALDWLGHDLQRIDAALELGRWYVETLGLRVSVRENGTWRERGWVRDVGPIAWKELAVLVPAPREDSLRVRLSFVTDAWRIDRVALATTVRRPDAHPVPLTRLTDADGAVRGDLRAAVRDPDTRYLRTMPGERFTLEWETGRTGATSTALLVAQGYYVEWLRPEWLTAPVGAFAPSGAALDRAFARWRAQRHDYEQRFFATRIPVR